MTYFSFQFNMSKYMLKGAFSCNAMYYVYYTNYMYNSSIICIYVYLNCLSYVPFFLGTGDFPNFHDSDIGDDDVFMVILFYNIYKASL